MQSRVPVCLDKKMTFNMYFLLKHLSESDKVRKLNYTLDYLALTFNGIENKKSCNGIKPTLTNHIGSVFKQWTLVY